MREISRTAIAIVYCQPGEGAKTYLSYLIGQVVYIFD